MLDLSAQGYSADGIRAVYTAAAQLDEPDETGETLDSYAIETCGDPADTIATARARS